MGDSPLGWVGEKKGKKRKCSCQMLAPSSRTVFCYSSIMVFRKMSSEAVSCSVFDVDSTGFGGRG